MSAFFVCVPMGVSCSEIEEQKVQLVICRIDAPYYAFYGEHIKEIVTVSEMTYIPGVPGYLRGVINLRGEIESVLDLRQAFSLPSQPVTKRSRILIGEAQNLRSGVLVDAVEDVLEIPEKHIQKPGTASVSALTPYVVGASAYQEHDLFILDLGSIFEQLLHY
jgi:purine-binding chemotaxis protein CheW